MYVVGVLRSFEKFMFLSYVAFENVILYLLSFFFEIDMIDVLDESGHTSNLS